MNRRPRSLLTRVRCFLREEDGPTAVEYAVMLAVIILASIGAVLSTGDVQQALWFDTGDAMSNAFDQSLGLSN